MLEEIGEPRRHVLVLELDRPLEVLGNLAVGRHRLAAIRVELALVDLAKHQVLGFVLGSGGT